MFKYSVVAQTTKKLAVFYVVSLSILFGGILYYAFTTESTKLINEKTAQMIVTSQKIEEELKAFHHQKSQAMFLSAHGYAVGLFDVDRIPVMSTLPNTPHWDQASWIDNGYLYVQHNLSVYFLGIKTVVCATPVTTDKIFWDVFPFFSSAFLGMLFVGFFLVRMAIEPVHSAFEAIDTFIKHAAHDINTPIASIVANIHLLQDEMLSAQQKKVINRIELGARSLTSLYEDIAFLSFGKRGFEKSICQVDQLIEERLALLDPLVQYKKLTVIKSLQPVTLDVVEIEFVRMVDNLLSNAIKYNRVGGSIRVTLDSHFLSIRDTGLGMTHEEKEKIFQRYWRGVSFSDGIGIGMEIVARVCQTYRFGLHIISTKHQGSEFIVSW